MKRVNIRVNNLPDAFHVWWEGICKEYPFSTMEIKEGDVAVCRVLSPAKNLNDIGDIKYGKIIRNGIGLFVEQTFIPKYVPEEDKVTVV